MQVRFLLGPAGGGKTHRCVDEIRRELAESPEGPPLVLLAPKQATYQLERRLLERDDVAGYTRPRVLSFERLAGAIVSELGSAPPRILTEEGRAMVLRALLSRHAEQLTIYRGSAKRAGFVHELNDLLRELIRQRVSPEALRAVAASRRAGDGLKNKLEDLARLMHAYSDWLRARNLRDADHVIGHAAELLLARGENFRLGGLWLDGFAELTPLERRLLRALVPSVPRMTLTFCIDAPPAADSGWLSVWSPIARLYRECFAEFSGQPGAEVRVETLPRRSDIGRFSGNETLARLERHWSDGLTAEGRPETGHVSIFRCANPEAEAVHACRELRRFVRGGGRYRGAAIILRGMEVYGDLLPRVLGRYEIPHFMDRRVPVSHHPLAELTRYSLRVVANQWRTEDLFGAWKTGLFSPADDDIDRLENGAIARGWKGETWRSALPDGAALERTRRELAAPLEEFCSTLRGPAFNGLLLSSALGGLWGRLGAESKLAAWDAAGKEGFHGTVWGEMKSWQKNVELAFEDQELGAREWVAIVEAGLAGLTAGAVPPALDQVLIGTVDRSRNPDLELTILLGMNEGVFPKAPPAPKLLTESERDLLQGHKMNLAGNRRDFIGRERFFGYIAGTRSRERLVITFAARNADGEAVNPSPFIHHVQSILPGTAIEDAPERFGWRDFEHPSELPGRALRDQRLFERGHRLSALLNLPAVRRLEEKLPIFRATDETGSLPEELVHRFFGMELRTSVSALERFAACPFQFFIHHALRGRERLEYRIGARERGSFLHEVLSRYHETAAANGGKWRDLSADEARETVRRVAREVSEGFNHGLMASSGTARFDLETMIRRLEEFVEMETAWMRHSSFDPWKTEQRFGGREGGLPPWRVELGGGRSVVLEGKIDRVDLAPASESGGRPAVVVDYKTRDADLDGLLMSHGITMQLPAYLNVLRSAARGDGTVEFAPAGMFYAPLAARPTTAKRRNEAGRDPEEERWRAFQFRGRFVAEKIAMFDDRATAEQRGDHFSYYIKKTGDVSTQTKDATPERHFRELLEQNAQTIQAIGRRIYEGEVRPAPYRKGARAACDRCDCQAICRVNIETHTFRTLTDIAKSEEQSS